MREGEKGREGGRERAERGEGGKVGGRQTKNEELRSEQEKRELLHHRLLSHDVFLIQNVNLRIKICCNALEV